MKLNFNKKIPFSIALFSLIFPIFTFAMSVNTPTINTGLVGYWSFNTSDVSGSIVYDRSGRGNNGTLINSPVLISGKINQAISLNGSNQYATASASASLNISGAQSYCMWFYSNGGTLGRFTKLPSGSNGGWILYDDTGTGTKWGLNLYDGSIAQYIHRGSSTTFSSGAWNHMCWTYDGGGSYTNLKIYLNGSEVTYTGSTKVGSFNQINTNTGDLFIGSNGGSSPFWNGNVDDVRFYNRALTSLEVSRMYSQTSNVYQSVIKTSLAGHTKINSSQNNNLTKGLVGLWSFNGPDILWGASTSTVYDRSGNGNNGIMNLISKKDVVFGAIGQAVRFTHEVSDSSCSLTSQVDIGGTSKVYLSTSTPFTISMWIKPYVNSYVSIYRGMINLITNKSQTMWTIAAITTIPNAYGNADFVFGSVNTWAKGIVTSTGIVLNKWQHVAITYNGIGAGDINNYKFYFQGQNKILGTTSGSYATNDIRAHSMIANTLQQNISNGCQNDWNGELDDVRIYNRALSAIEVKQLYNMAK